jgi:hypothetical protein
MNKLKKIIGATVLAAAVTSAVWADVAGQSGTGNCGACSGCADCGTGASRCTGVISKGSGSNSDVCAYYCCPTGVGCGTVTVDGSGTAQSAKCADGSSGTEFDGGQ